MGTSRAPLVPITRPDGARTPRGAEPAPGEHTDAIPRALGMAGERTAALRRGGMISGTALSGGPDLSERRRSAAAAEQRAPQPTQRGEERDAPAPAPTAVRGVARGQLQHQQRRLRGLAPRHGGAAQHREMAVEPRTGRTAPTCDGRHTRPAAHRYLFHVTPHPYEGTRPRAGQPYRPGLTLVYPGRPIAHGYTEVDVALPLPTGSGPSRSARCRPGSPGARNPHGGAFAGAAS